MAPAMRVLAPNLGRAKRQVQARYNPPRSGPDACTEATMDGYLYPVRIPDGTVIDGAVIELYRAEDGILAAEIRISGPAVT